MVSRRQFLQTNLVGLSSSSAITDSLAKPTETQVASSQLSANPRRDYWNDWSSYLTSRVSQCRAERKAELASIRDQKEVRERTEIVRSRVWEILGGPIDKTALNSRTVGTIERDAYRVEKVIFESQPEVYVSANLYVPKEGQPPFPAVLSPLGHYPEGKEARDYQMLFQNLARQGYVVLAFDPFGQGERRQFLDSKTGKPLYGPTLEHDMAGWPMLLLGATLAQYMVWDCIRAVDYLVSRPEVAANRIGCVGHSGGATITMYMCALEPRIKVAVEVEGHTRNFAGPHYVPPGAVADAEQNLVAGMKMRVDRGDLLWAFVPKPLLMIYTVNDALERPSYVEAVEEIYDECRQAYRLLGAEGHVRLFTAYLPHEFNCINRRETYAWLNRWLGTKDQTVAEAPFDVSAPGALDCTSTGQVLTSLGGRSVVQINSDRARAVAGQNPLQAGSLEPGELRIRVRKALRARLSLPLARFPLRIRILSTSERPDATVEEFAFHSEEQIRVPGWFMKPKGYSQPLPTILYVSENGKDAAVTEDEEQGELWPVVRMGFAVCVISLRGYNETSPAFPSPCPLWYYHGGGSLLRDDYAWASLILGNPVLGQQVWDFLRCLDFLESREDVDTRQIRVAGWGGGGLVSLFGMVLDERPRSLLCGHMISDYRSVVECQDYHVELSWLVPGLLRNFDLPDLVATLAPRRCFLLNALNARGDILPESIMQTRFKIARDCYASMGSPNQLQFIIRAVEPRSQLLLNWLKDL
jgi:cephalosporin-C deacetylase-like acetyl esterase